MAAPNKIGFDWPSDFLEKKIFKQCEGRQTDDGAWVYYKLSFEPSVQVS